MTKRELVLENVKIAGYHNDAAAGTRAFIGGHISNATYLKAWRKGQRAKEAGVRCDCLDCRRERGEA
jgi:hypothetical protein